MKNQPIKALLFTTFLSLALTACTSTRSTEQHVHTYDSGKVLFSDIFTTNIEKGIKVTGNVRKKTPSGKRITIPGHIHIVHENKDGKALETVNARTHRNYSNSRVWHFDGMLKTLPTEGSTIVVKYHNRHPE